VSVELSGVAGVKMSIEVRAGVGEMLEGGVAVAGIETGGVAQADPSFVLSIGRRGDGADLQPAATRGRGRAERSAQVGSLRVPASTRTMRDVSRSTVEKVARGLH